MTPPRHPDLPAGPLGYPSAETTGVVSPAGEHLKRPIDLSDVLDLRRPNRNRNRCACWARPWPSAAS